MGKHNKTIALDLDATIAQYNGFKINGRFNIGDPIPGAREFVKTLRKKYSILIYTCRCNVSSSRDSQQHSDPAKFLQEIVQEWLDKHGIPYDNVYVGQGKPHANYFIDDRGVRCNHKEDPNAYENILNFILGDK